MQKLLLTLLCLPLLAKASPLLPVRFFVEPSSNAQNVNVTVTNDSLNCISGNSAVNLTPDSTQTINIKDCGNGRTFEVNFNVQLASDTNPQKPHIINYRGRYGKDGLLDPIYHWIGGVRIDPYKLPANVDATSNCRRTYCEVRFRTY